MRLSLLRTLLIASATCLLSLSVASAPAMAQTKPKTTAPAKKPGTKPTGKPGAGTAAPAPSGSQSIELDDAPANPQQGTPTKPADSGPPPVAGQMTEQAAQAKRLFDGEKWGDAATALYRVSKGETGDDEGNKQLAQYHLAISLYRLKFYQGAYGIFSEIADKQNHLKFNETLLWLAKLATDLPEPADIVERVGKYNDGQIDKFNNPNQRELYWQLNYLLGRYKYRNRQYDDSLRLFSKIDRQSKYYVRGQFFSGISNVQLRRSVPAVQSFQRIVGAIDQGVEGIEDEEARRVSAYGVAQARLVPPAIEAEDGHGDDVDGNGGEIELSRAADA